MESVSINPSRWLGRAALLAYTDEAIPMTGRLKIQLIVITSEKGKLGTPNLQLCCQ